MEVAVVQTGPPEAARLRVTVHGAPLDPEVKQAVTAALERLLGLRIDLAEFYRLASRDAELGPLAERFRGMKPPRFASVFEGVVNSIACQQVTLTLGIRLLNRLAESYGPVVAGEEGPTRAFPRPEDLARLVPEALRELGFSRQKGRAVIELARITRKSKRSWKGWGPCQTRRPSPACAGCAAWGVGRRNTSCSAAWDGHTFFRAMTSAPQELAALADLADPLDYEAVGRTLIDWQPFGGLIYFHLLLDRLAEAGYLQTAEPQTGATTAGRPRKRSRSWILSMRRVATRSRPATRRDGGL